MKPRFRIRTLMIAVAVVGIPLGWLTSRRSSFQRRSIEHFAALNEADRRKWMRYEALDADGPYTRMGYFEPASDSDPQVVRFDRLFFYHAELANKYQDAARYPWLPVAPDPPEPK